MTNEELDELQKVRSIVDRFKDIDEEECTIEKAFDECPCNPYKDGDDEW